MIWAILAIILVILIAVLLSITKSEAYMCLLVLMIPIFILAINLGTLPQEAEVSKKVFTENRGYIYFDTYTQEDGCVFINDYWCTEDSFTSIGYKHHTNQIIIKLNKMNKDNWYAIYERQDNYPVVVDTCK